MILRKPRRAALAAIAILVAAASAASFAESYRALVLWASHHGLHGLWAAIFPAQIDTFVLVGELALFVALADGWAPRSRYGAWTVTLAGLAVSVGGNVGHVAGHSLTYRATAAVPPLAGNRAGGRARRAQAGCRAPPRQRAIYGPARATRDRARATHTVQRRPGAGRLPRLRGVRLAAVGPPARGPA